MLQRKTFLRVVLPGLVVIMAFGAWQRFGAGKSMERRGMPMGEKVTKTEDQWREQLTPEQFQVTRCKGTERAYSGSYWNSKEDGIYECVCCGQPLFDAKTKFESGTGWPSFWEPDDENHVSLIEDNSWFMRRTEVICSRCDAHLGHVFKDGPPPTGLRYCMNSAALKLVKRGTEKKPDERGE
jgi:peptide-methionine (R)-S-oxide reductase